MTRSRSERGTDSGDGRHGTSSTNANGGGIISSSITNSTAVVMDSSFAVTTSVAGNSRSHTIADATTSTRDIILSESTGNKNDVIILNKRRRTNLVIKLRDVSKCLYLIAFTFCMKMLTGILIFTDYHQQGPTETAITIYSFLFVEMVASILQIITVFMSFTM